MKSKYLSLAVPMMMLIVALFTSSNATAQPPEAPRILVQPEDQMVHLDAPTVFTVRADGEPLNYQWLHNGVTLTGETNLSLTIAKTSINDAGFYLCNVAQAQTVTSTRVASLSVFENHIDENTGIDPVTIWATPTATGGSNGVCPGHYTGTALYSKTIAQGWGWSPDTNTTVYTATDTNRTNTKIEYSGKLGDHNCAQSTITVPSPTTSTVYRFTIYFTNNVPTNPYPITLNGFNP